MRKRTCRFFGMETAKQICIRTQGLLLWVITIDCIMWILKHKKYIKKEHKKWAGLGAERHIIIRTAI